VFMSSHILADVERVCQQVAIIARGRLVAQANQEELRRRYAAPVFEIETMRPASALAERLRRLDWVAHVDEAGNVLRLAAHDERRARQELPSMLSDLGADLVRYQPMRPTLEDVFVRLVEAQGIEQPVPK